MIAAALMLALKAGLICLLLLGCYLGLDKHSARLRYQWLSMAAALLFLFPFFDYALNSFSIAVAVRPSHFLLQNPVHFIQQAWVQYLLMVYCFVASWLLLYSIMGLLRLAQIEKQAKQANKELNSRLEMLAAKLSIKKTPALRIHHSESISPCTFGFLRPIVLLPANAESWPKAQLDLVLLHELAHIKHRDFLRINSARFLLAIYWFLPPLWWLLAELKNLSEQLADDTVLNAGANDADYAEVLMEAGRLHKQASAMAVAVNGNGEYYQRVMTVLDRYVDRAPQKSNVSRPLFWFLLLIAVSAAALDLKVEDKGYLKLPMNLVSVDPISSEEVATSKELWHESLKLVAIKTSAGPNFAQLSMSGDLAVDTNIPEVEPFKGLTQDLKMTARFNIDHRGKAYSVEIDSMNDLPVLKALVEDSIRKTQFPEYRLNGEPVLLTGLRQQYQFQKIETEEGKRNMNIKNSVATALSASLACISASCSSVVSGESENVVEMQSENKAPLWELISYGKARFPKRAIMNGMQGWVDLDFNIGLDGGVKDIRVLKTSNGRNFVRDAKISLKKFKFKAPSSAEEELAGVAFRMCFIFSKEGKQDINKKKVDWKCGFSSNETNIDLSKGKGIANTYLTRRGMMMDRRREENANNG